MHVFVHGGLCTASQKYCSNSDLYKKNVHHGRIHMICRHSRAFSNRLSCLVLAPLVRLMNGKSASAAPGEHKSVF